MTRCKPGDLAYIIRSDFSTNVGMPVTVLDVGLMFPEVGYAWIVESKTPLECWFVHGSSRIPIMTLQVLVPDAWLRPIRDPGPEAVDQVLRRVGLPLGLPA